MLILKNQMIARGGAECRQETLALPNDDRVRLADRLVESLDSLDEDEFRRLWADEALRRRDEIRSGLVDAIPGDEALRQIRQAIAEGGEA